MVRRLHPSAPGGLRAAKGGPGCALRHAAALCRGPGIDATIIMGLYLD